MNLTYIHIRVLPETFSVLVQRQPGGGGVGWGRNGRYRQFLRTAPFNLRQ